MMRMLRDLLIPLPFTLHLLLLILHVAYTSHFRGAAFWFDFDDDGNSEVMKLHFWVSWGLNASDEEIPCDRDVSESGALTSPDWSEFVTCLDGCDGEITDVAVQCYYANPEQRWWVGSRTAEVSLPPVTSNTVTFSWTGRGWFGELTTRADARWRQKITAGVAIRPDTGKRNASPYSTLGPIVHIQAGCTDHYTINIPVEDADGDQVRCRMANTEEECGGVCNVFPTAYLLTDSCQLVLPAGGSLMPGFYAVAIQLEDFALRVSNERLSSVPLQFLVQVFMADQPCSLTPYLIAPTPENRVCTHTQSDPRGVFSLTLAARTADNYTMITSLPVTTFSGMVTSQLRTYNESSSDFYVNLTWPISSIPTTLPICFYAIDSMQRISEENCITVVPYGSVKRPHVVSVTIWDGYRPKVLVTYNDTVARPVFTRCVRVWTRQLVEVDSCCAPLQTQVIGSDITCSLNTQWIPGRQLTVDDGLVIGLGSRCADSLPATTVDGSLRLTIIEDPELPPPSTTTTTEMMVSTIEGDPSSGGSSSFEWFNRHKWLLILVLGIAALVAAVVIAAVACKKNKDRIVIKDEPSEGLPNGGFVVDPELEQVEVVFQ